MATWAEAEAGKRERLRREQRYFTVDKRGPRCPVCHLFTSRELVEATGTPVHPTCDPTSAELMAAAQ